VTERRAVLTGASRGLGLEWVRQLATAGWSVVAAARDPDGSAGLMKLVAEWPELVRPERLDVSDPTSIIQLAARVAARWPSVDLLVNNAGVNAGGDDRAASAGPVPGVDAEALTGVLRINAVGPVLVTQAFAGLLAAAAPARVVNISSRLGSLAIASSADDPYERDYGYRMSKVALNMASVQLAGDLAGQGTIVVSMSPGWVRTDMTHDRADLSVDESVTGQLATTLALEAADSGRYLAHTGEPIPW
jgi:NAD(P)-dependent dehydrogenase (short-subunit alcohol dehydrogenase family)